MVPEEDVEKRVSDVPRDAVERVKERYDEAIQVGDGFWELVYDPFETRSGS